HQRRALPEEAERDHERAAERLVGGERILGDDRRQRLVLEGRRAREQLHGARRGSQVRMGLFHPEARGRLGAGAEHPRERPGFGRVVGRNAVAVQAHAVGHAASPAPQYVAKKSSSSWASAPPQRATSRSPSPMSRYASPTARAPPIGPSVIARQNPWASWAMAT